MKVLLVAVNAKFSHTNLAVRYLAQPLAAAGIACEMPEFTINQQVKELVGDIFRRNASVILFSCYIWNIELICKVAADLRILCPEVRILLGGPEVSYESAELLKRYAFADGILAGEGEKIVVEAVLSSCRGEIYRADAYVALDELSFPYENFDILSNRVLYYESSRGCPFGCSYCLSSADRQVRYRSLSLVFQDLQRFLDARVMRVKFVDRTFNLDAQRASAIWAYLIERDNGVTGFQMELGGDLITGEQIALLRKARPGLLQFEIGVQSTQQQALEKACRKTDLERLKWAVGEIQAGGNIHCHLDLIAGLPEEGFERFLQSYDEVFALRPEQLQLGFLKLLRGSKLWEQREAYGLRFSGYAPYEILETPVMGFAQMERLKGLEEMTEVYWNSGRFFYSLRYLLGACSAARFFLALSETMPETRPGKYEYYDLLYSFAKKQGGYDLTRLGWLLRADLCCNERPKKVAACMPMGRRVRDRELGDGDVYGEYFPFDFCGEDEGERVIVFDYGRRDLSGRATHYSLK